MFFPSMFSVLWFLWSVAITPRLLTQIPVCIQPEPPSPLSSLWRPCPLPASQKRKVILVESDGDTFWLTFLSSIFAIHSCWGAGAMQHVFVFVVVTHLFEWPNMSHLFRDLSLSISLCCLHLPVHDSCYHPYCYEE